MPERLQLGCLLLLLDGENTEAEENELKQITCLPASRESVTEEGRAMELR